MRKIHCYAFFIANIILLQFTNDYCPGGSYYSISFLLIMEHIKIKKIETQDVLSACAKILMDTYNATPWNDAWTAEKALEKLECFYHSPKFIGLLAYEGNELIGACIGNIEPYYTGDYFYLKEMFVTPSCQKKGIGLKMMETLKQHLASLEINQIILFTSKDYFPFNFYQKGGFNTIDGMQMMHFETHKNESPS